MKCPGQDSRYWKPGAIYEAKCPKCGHEVEFFKDEPARKCRNCGYRFINPKMDFGCASYCKYAKQCLGELPQELLAKREDLLKDRVAIQMKRYFGRDFKRIAHATKTARYAEQIVKEEGGMPAIVLSAAYLREIGIKEAEEKHPDNPEKYQIEEGLPIATEILKNLDAKEELIEEVCNIISKMDREKEKDDLNSKILHDADLIVAIEERLKDSEIEKTEMEKLVNRFLTKTGQELAKKKFLNTR